MDDSEIRKRLQDIDSKNVKITDQRGLVEELKKIESKVSVQFVQASTNWSSEYICHHYTLNVSESSGLFTFTDTRIFRQGECVIFDELECLGFIQEIESIKNADIIVYYKEKQGRKLHIHSGKVKQNMILSKWGKGNVWMHLLEHVPAHYEDNGLLKIKYFKYADIQKAKNYLDSL